MPMFGCPQNFVAGDDDADDDDDDDTIHHQPNGEVGTIHFWEKETYWNTWGSTPMYSFHPCVASLPTSGPVTVNNYVGLW